MRAGRGGCWACWLHLALEAGRLSFHRKFSIVNWSSCAESRIVCVRKDKWGHRGSSGCWLLQFWSKECDFWSWDSGPYRNLKTCVDDRYCILTQLCWQADYFRKWLLQMGLVNQAVWRKKLEEVQNFDLPKSREVTADIITHTMREPCFFVLFFSFQT